MPDVSTTTATEAAGTATAAEIAWHVAQLRQDRAGLAPDNPSRSDAARAYQQGWRDAYDKVAADLTARAVQRAATPTTTPTPEV